MFRIIHSFSFVVAALAAGAVPAVAAGDKPAAAGHALVKTFCSRCHATEKTGESPMVSAPRLRDIHLRYDVEQLGEALVEGIATAHPGMPEFQFDQAEASAIIAYLKSLER